MVFVTKVSQEHSERYKAWLTQIQNIEKTFPGFQRAHVSAPRNPDDDSWVTFLQFDTSENLDRWLNSQERRDILKEAEPLVTSFQYHHVSPYAGWFDSDYSIVKQTMLVLLVLYPIVMLQLKYLTPLTAHLNSAVAMFIANTISVSLISWPFLPLVIKLLDWWLQASKIRTHILGALVVIALYALLIAVFAGA
ncbi:MAG: antibiotic biosynthesis monooxygenase [Verrucomicrobia bacterium]|nr:antibiotic biosynthesis monooxygenase [Verrucomicrobiota bacterium]